MSHIQNAAHSTRLPGRGAVIGVPIAVVGIVVMLVVPLPAVLLDVLIALNITGALLVLLTAMFVHRPLDFSVVPGADPGADPVPAGAQRQRDPAGAAATGTPAR